LKKKKSKNLLLKTVFCVCEVHWRVSYFISKIEKNLWCTLGYFW
jgi:hypothetical protein